MRAESSKQPTSERQTRRIANAGREAGCARLSRLALAGASENEARNSRCNACWRKDGLGNIALSLRFWHRPSEIARTFVKPAQAGFFSMRAPPNSANDCVEYWLDVLRELRVRMEESRERWRYLVVRSDRPSARLRGPEDIVSESPQSKDFRCVVVAIDRGRDEAHAEPFEGGCAVRTYGALRPPAMRDDPGDHLLLACNAFDAIIAIL
ncbi:hypothetical protein BamMEX5DRAFT_5328 [Burkholderia ambifaria MEX-5]|uniref:Uncharacterized protein n=1 Tax=Burkholderia ambifaria MEX-5 TaxID=396597 RepID=B1TC12_9BURK|nr:hypothetical protein BamMEX5DRAFT_5328 [Burkholderia ambifaria MEX-5]